MSGDTFNNVSTSDLQTSPPAVVTSNSVQYSNNTVLTQESDDDNFYFFEGSGMGVDGFTYTFEGASDTNTACTGGEHSASNQRNFFALELAVGTMPIELKSFKVNVKESDAVLVWSTFTELNNDRFIIEYSVDGRNFHELGEIAGQGTTHELSEYKYVHHNASLEAKLIYYRLLQIDYDGRKSYKGKIQTATFRNADISVYPLLVHQGEAIKVQYGELGGKYTILSITGEVMGSKVINSSSFEIETNELSSGVYILQFSNGEIVRFIVK